MKNYLFIILIAVSICFSQNVNAQYKSIFGKTETSWNVLITAPDIDLTDSLVVTYDTVDNGLTYKKLVNIRYNLYSNFHGLLREDTSLGKIWFKKEYDTVENLISNLSLALGDTFVSQFKDFNSLPVIVD